MEIQAWTAPNPGSLARHPASWPTTFCEEPAGSQRRPGAAGCRRRVARGFFDGS